MEANSPSEEEAQQSIGDMYVYILFDGFPALDRVPLTNLLCISQ